MELECKHRVNETCCVIGELAATDPVPVVNATCLQCAADNPPKGQNRTTANAAVRYLRRTDRDKLKERLPVLRPLRECPTCPKPTLASSPKPSQQTSQRTPTNQQTRSLVLHVGQSPGDILTLTAAIRSLHIAYPETYRVAVESPCQAIFEHNPDVVDMAPDEREQALRIKMHYPTIHQSDDRHVPFLGAYCAFLADMLEIPIPLAVNRPLLFISEEEHAWMPQVAEATGGACPRYWVVNAGVKPDFTAKQWPIEYYQEVVDRTRDRIQWVQVGEQRTGHSHPALEHVIDLRGQTDARQLIRLVYHARGGLGPVTWLQHLCAAVELPYVCLVGGREPVPWVTYPLQTTLHTIGQMPCCRTRACWCSRVVATGDGDPKDESLCKRPVLTGQRPVAECMARIKPETVTAVLQQLEEGV